MNRGQRILLLLAGLCAFYTGARNRSERLAPPASEQTAALDALVDDEALLAPAAPETIRDKTAVEVVAYAKRYLGSPYRYGGESPDGFDCSGFTRFVFKRFGYELPHRSLWQFERCDKLDADDLLPGDLVFFAGSKGGNDINHTGIVTEVDNRGEFRFIHAASTGVVVSESRQTYYAERYIGACRVVR